MEKKAVIITGPGFQDEEVVYPYYRLLEEGFKTEIATKDGEVVYGKYGVPARASMNTIDLNAADFDLVVLPGGFEAPDRVRLLPEVLDFIQKIPMYIFYTLLDLKSLYHTFILSIFPEMFVLFFSLPPN